MTFDADLATEFGALFSIINISKCTYMAENEQLAALSIKTVLNSVLLTTLLIAVNNIKHC